MLRRQFFLAILVSLAAFARIATAEQTMWSDGTPGQPVGIPIYDPGSKRYFALMRAQTDPQAMSMWLPVSQAAQRQEFRGVRGRLAIVDSLEVHEFLLRTFRPNEYQYIWIGLKYFCRAQRLQWDDGQPFPPGSFQLWDAQWTHDAYTCKDTTNPNDWGGVAYTPRMKSWVVSGHAKGYNWYFVEYPTGEP